jgi:predicted component of type VI protein secretion system
MFLRRKFGDPATRNGFEDACRNVLPRADWSTIPEPICDVVNNLQVLLSARRCYDHIALDFGLSPNEGQTGLAAQIERIQRELPGIMVRYERRFDLSALEVDVDDDGASFMIIKGNVRGLSGTLCISFSLPGRKITRINYAPESSGGEP